MKTAIKKVLIVDDSAYMRFTLRDILLKEGFEIAGEAESGKEAVEKYKKFVPDLVTMDIVLSSEDGIYALRNIIEVDPDAKVLMVSAMNQQALIVEAIQAGAKGFIIKPFKNEDVVSEITRILGD